MVDFRRCFLALVALVLAIGFVAPASAQVATFQCAANAAVPPTLRAEGLTELIGDIVLNCSGGVPTAPGTIIPTANVTVFLPNAVTSRITQTGTTLVDALLLVDEPAAGLQRVCTAPTNPVPVCSTPETGDGGASFATNGYFNVYQGVLTGPNAVTFLGVPVDPPATSGAPTRVFRITNIRTNASAYPASSVTPVQAFVSISSSTSVPITNAEPIVGFIAPGLVYGTNKGIPVKAGTTSFLQCESFNTVASTVTFTEGFATSFKIRDAGPFSGLQMVPGAIYNTESGLIVPDNLSGATSAYFGVADLGTRLKITFANLPHGITLSVPTVITDTVGGTIVLVSANNASAGYDDVADSGLFGGPTGLTSDTGLFPLTINYASSAADTGSAAAVYEVFAANANAVDSFPVAINVSFTGAPGVPGSPDITGTNPQPTVAGGFAPSPSGGSFTLTTGSVAEPEPWPIPRFVDSTVTTNIFSIALCQTVLLFPYVTDYPGFDTGIAISNTSADPLGIDSAAPQTGSCAVTFYGGVTGSTGAFTNTAANLNGTTGSYTTTAANTFTTGLIGPGQTWAFAVSTIDSTFGTSGFAGFVGYAIAQCNFQYGHGYAFVSDYGLRNFAASYLALIIPDAVREPVPNVCSSLVVGGDSVGCFPTGEQLVH